MTICALCSGESREAVLIFHHIRKAERVTLEIALCEICGNNLEKHLKRAVPKRLMEFATLERFRDQCASVETTHLSISPDTVKAA